MARKKKKPKTTPTKPKQAKSRQTKSAKKKKASRPLSRQKSKRSTGWLAKFKLLPQRQKRPTEKKKKKRLFWRITFWLLFSTFLLLVIGLAVYLFKDLPSPTRLTSQSFPASTLIFDRNGHQLYEIYTEKNRVPIKLDEIPEYIKWATVASEDKDFYQHHGFAFRGILRAAYNTLFRRSLQGGSTITQQLIKNTLLSPERTLRRKAREAVLSLVTETIYSKDEILQMYLNQVPYGGTAWGIEAAAQTYFNKSARDLTLAEAALLAGLPASPTRFSPFGAHPELAKSRQVRVLQAMVRDGYIQQEEMEAASNQELTFAPTVIEIKAPHFVLWVKELLVEQLGERLVEQGGLRVTTTLDLDLQEFSQEAVATQVAQLKSRQVTNGAALVTNPETGEILSMVGSHDYFDQEHDGNVNVTLRPRQPGSSIKPLNYALAIEKKLITPATLLNDVPTCFTVTGQKPYCPVNYDGRYRGPIQVRFALGNSVNIPAVKVLALNGIEAFYDKAREMGISTWQDPSEYGLSLTLGGGEVTMYDMATAFSTLANLGVRQDLYAIKKVENLEGKVIFEQAEIEGPRVLSMETAYLISHILLDNNARAGGFGSRSDLVIKDHPEVSVKTGTTNDFRDAWTIGYTPSILVVTWMGNNDNTQMKYGTAGVTAAAPAWNQIMSHLLENKDQEWHLKPEAIVGTHICTPSGKSPNPAASCQTRFEYFIKDTIPSETENLTQMIEMDKTNGAIADGQTPPENRELQEHLVLYDALHVPYCLDCPVATPSSRIYYPLAGQSDQE